MLEKQYAYLNNYVTNAEAKLNTITKLFKIGKKSLLEFLAAQTDYNSARGKLVNTKYDLVYTKIKLLKALGVLPEMVNKGVKSSIGITEDGLHDYASMNYHADSLPVDDRALSTGGINIDSGISFNTTNVQSFQAPVATTAPIAKYSSVKSTYREEYVKKPSSKWRSSKYRSYKRFKTKAKTSVYSSAKGKVIDTLSAGSVITGHSSGGWIKVTGIANHGWKRYGKTGYVKSSSVNVD